MMPLICASIAVAGGPETGRTRTSVPHSRHAGWRDRDRRNYAIRPVISAKLASEAIAMQSNLDLPVGELVTISKRIK
jgi:hypothetical protein